MSEPVEPCTDSPELIQLRRADFTGRGKPKSKNPMKASSFIIGKNDLCNPLPARPWGAVFLALLVTSCAGPSGGEPEQGPSIVDAGAFTVCPPPGKGWLTQIDRKKGLVKFHQPAKTITGGQKSTSIQVFHNGLRQDAGPRTEQEAADELRALEEQSLIQGVLRGEYKLGTVEKGVTTIGDKKLHTLSYKTTKGTVFPNLGPASAAEAVLFLYFPPDFSSSRRFFSILMVEAYQKGALASVDFSRAEPVIKSLSQKPALYTPGRQ